MDIETDVSAFILAGGKSRRMGRDKAFVELNGRTLLSRQLDLARSVCANARIVADTAKFSQFAPVIEDVFPGCGPLAGIHAALRSSQTELNLILAVDIPFLSAKFLEFMIAKSRASRATVTIARTSDGWQPLCAVYRPEFADLAEEALKAGRYRIDALFKPEITETVDEGELRDEGFSTDLFGNLNTPEDLSGCG
jgi:molybdopterin-guanine dinucleotide biosynthesis protein A